MGIIHHFQLCFFFFLLNPREKWKAAHFKNQRNLLFVKIAPTCSLKPWDGLSQVTSGKLCWLVSRPSVGGLSLWSRVPGQHVCLCLWHLTQQLGAFLDQQGHWVVTDPVWHTAAPPFTLLQDTGVFQKYVCTFICSETSMPLASISPIAKGFYF